ncbi:hypothetical protein LY78DRAFT_707613 [Colletotrichum sublineola]|nr:hypothetical protein LY78DRAFT_707613 [Colletotrichum sublineola]
MAYQSFITILLLSGRLWTQERPTDAACAKQLSPYSPYLETSSMEFLEYTEENHLMQPSPYRGTPTPEIEEAWIRLWRKHKADNEEVLPIHFPEDKLAALNKTPPERYEHVSENFGGGVKGFLNVFHQLHCLSFIRQYTYRDVYDYSNVTAFRAPQEVVRGHVDHCIETLRKSLMCTSDVTPIVFKLDPSRAPGTRSDFNIRRKCRNFEKIQTWSLENRGI